MCDKTKIEILTNCQKKERQKNGGGDLWVELY